MLTLPCFLRLENVSARPRLRAAVRPAISANLLVETTADLREGKRLRKWASDFFGWRKVVVDFRAKAVAIT